MSERTGPTRVSAVPRQPGTVLPVLLHLAGGLLAMIGPVLGWVGVVAVLPSLITFLVARGRPEVREAARGALNFQITWVGLMVVLQAGAPLIGQAVLSNGHYFDVFVLLLVVSFVCLAIALFDLIASAWVGFGASRDRPVRYPLSLHLIR